jgi:hypothetical protein
MIKALSLSFAIIFWPVQLTAMSLKGEVLTHSLPKYVQPHVVLKSTPRQIFIPVQNSDNEPAKFPDSIRVDGLKANFLHLIGTDYAIDWTPIRRGLLEIPVLWSINYRGWDTPHDGWMVDRVNHSEIYSDHGKHRNMVEIFFSRLRNMIEGQHHGVSPKYLHQYANHSAWLEDNRRTDNGTLAHIVVSNAMDAPVSRNWKGYWQRAA